MNDSVIRGFCLSILLFLMMFILYIAIGAAFQIFFIRGCTIGMSGIAFFGSMALFEKPQFKCKNEKRLKRFMMKGFNIGLSAVITVLFYTAFTSFLINP